jgi:hypothetical protein
MLKSLSYGIFGFISVPVLSICNQIAWAEVPHMIGNLHPELIELVTDYLENQDLLSLRLVSNSARGSEVVRDELNKRKPVKSCRELIERDEDAGLSRQRGVRLVVALDNGLEDLRLCLNRSNLNAVQVLTLSKASRDADVDEVIQFLDKTPDLRQLKLVDFNVGFENFLKLAAHIPNLESLEVISPTRAKGNLVCPGPDHLQSLQEGQLLFHLKYLKWTSPRGITCKTMGADISGVWPNLVSLEWGTSWGVDNRTIEFWSGLEKLKNLKVLRFNLPFLETFLDQLGTIPNIETLITPYRTVLMERNLNDWIMAANLKRAELGFPLLDFK